MAISIMGERFPLSVITPTTDFVVCGQKIYFVFEDKKPTNKVGGVRLELFDGKKRDRFFVKVPGVQELPFEENKVKEMTIHINLVNPTFTLYSKKETANIEFSVVADSFKEIGKNSKEQSVSNIDSVL